MLLALSSLTPRCLLRSGRSSGAAHRRTDRRAESSAVGASPAQTHTLTHRPAHTPGQDPEAAARTQRERHTSPLGKGTNWTRRREREREKIFLSSACSCERIPRFQPEHWKLPLSFFYLFFLQKNCFFISLRLKVSQEVETSAAVSPGIITGLTCC